jgi:hypothetical protein
MLPGGDVGVGLDARRELKVGHSRRQLLVREPHLLGDLLDRQFALP